AEVDADRIAVVAGKRLPLHRPPRLFAREPLVAALPALAAVAGHVHRGLAAGRRARPVLGAVHREHPRGVRIARVRDDAEADVADVLRHVAADAHPAVARAIDAVDAAVVLHPQPIRVRRVLDDTVRIVTVLVLRAVGLRRREVHVDTEVERAP